MQPVDCQVKTAYIKKTLSTFCFKVLDYNIIIILSGSFGLPSGYVQCDLNYVMFYLQQVS